MRTLGALAHAQCDFSRRPFGQSLRPLNRLQSRVEIILVSTQCPRIKIGKEDVFSQNLCSESKNSVNGAIISETTPRDKDNRNSSGQRERGSHPVSCRHLRLNFKSETTCRQVRTHSLLLFHATELHIRFLLVVDNSSSTPASKTNSLAESLLHAIGLLRPLTDIQNLCPLTRIQW